MRDASRPNPEVKELVVSLRAHHSRTTRRQGEVLTLQALGLSPDDIASLLGISSRTVESHARSAWATVVPSSLPATRGIAAAWAFLHRGCCLAAFFQEYVGAEELP